VVVICWGCVGELSMGNWNGVKGYMGNYLLYMERELCWGDFLVVLMGWYDF
jgi:hypothetical protein